MKRCIFLAILCLCALYGQTKLFDIVQYTAQLPVSKDTWAQIDAAGRGILSHNITARMGEAEIESESRSVQAELLLCEGSAESNHFRLLAGHWPRPALGDIPTAALQIDAAQALFADPYVKIGQNITINGQRCTLVGLFSDSGFFSAMQERAVVMAYDDQSAQGLIEFCFKSGNAPLYREFLENTLFAQGVNDIDNIARINACIIAVALLILLSRPATQSVRKIRTDFRQIAESLQAHSVKVYSGENLRLHRRDMALFVMKTIVLSFLILCAAIFLTKFLYLPPAILPENLRSLTQILNTIRSYSIAQNAGLSAPSASLSQAQTARTLAWFLLVCSSTREHRRIL